MIPVEDLYGLLGLEIQATFEQIRSAYRKKALKVHPDKNPDDPVAADKFHKLSEALKILSDAEARKAYDNVIKAKEAAAARHKKLDAKRQKLKEDLEKREKEAESRELLQQKLSEEERLVKEIERLRKEGSKELEEEQELLKSQIFSNINQEVSQDCRANKIKLKWKKDDNRYSKESLENMFFKYGDLDNIVISSRSALIEMKDPYAAKMATNIETGFPDNPLKLKLLSNDGKRAQVQATNVLSEASTSLRAESDYETLVMRKLRQEEERKRLIKKITEEEALQNS